jgi:hypothetical protein
MNSDLNLRAERQQAAVGMVGAVADLSRSNAAWMSVRNLHLQLRFSHEKFRYGSQGAGGGSAERVTKRQSTRSAHLHFDLARKRAAAESPLAKIALNSARSS